MLAIAAAAAWFLLGAVVLLACYAVWQRVMVDNTGRAGVVVIGDYGRSPRMQYHTASLGKVCREVYVVGMGGSSPCREVTDAGNVNLSLLMGDIVLPGGMPWVVRTLVRLGIQLLRIPFVMFWKLPRCKFIVLQNPPAVPILPIAVLACKIRGMKLIVDWHNLGYTLMELDHRPPRAVSAYKWIERKFGAMGDWHLCVCKSLQNFLENEWKVLSYTNSVVMYDHAPTFFTRRGPGGYDELQAEGNLEEIITSNETLKSFTDSKTSWKTTRPALLVTGTSWTVDEDVGMLISALKSLDEKLGLKGDSSLPDKIVMIITGKGGALKEQREQEIRQMKFTSIEIYTGFLKSIGDYATLLGAADLGISLHNSSSGYDLPMKVVDMFGTSLPVLALRFPTLSELVTAATGDTFLTQSELTSMLEKMLSNWSVDASDKIAATPILEKYRRHHLENPHGSWDAEWRVKTGPVVEKALK